MATIPEALAIALQHHQAGRLAEAEQVYRQILAAEPNQAEALHLLGVIAQQVGQHEVAIQYIGRAIELKGDVAAFHSNLGEAYRAMRRTPEAVACYRRALQLKPDLAEAHNSLGIACGELGRHEEAIACYQRAIQFQPDYAEAHNNLGVIIAEQGKLEAAAACYRRALQLKPDYAEAHNNLGITFGNLGKQEEALACYRRALQLQPDFAQAHNNLGSVLKDQGHLDEAVACYRRALELKPGYADAHNNLGNVLKDQGHPDEALASYRRALEFEPDFTAAHSNLLLALQYGAGVTPAALAAAHAAYDRQHAAALRGAVAPYANIRDGDRPLRLGFVSPDLGQHPVGFFLVRVLENLGLPQQETVCYHDRAAQDDLTHRLRAAATQWREVFGLSDRQLDERIRADRIDILFDLAGHTAHNRLLVFARKPAPLQITWIGYEGATGLSAMDYLLADRHMVPAPAEHDYREQVLRMPEGYVCFDPPAAAPPVGPLPARAPGEVTLGSFNNLAKITPAVVQVWAAILRRLPKGRLVLQYRGLAAESVRQRYRALFAACGIDPGRLTLLPHSGYEAYLAAHQQLDLALDPFPFSGSATTCAALWMGVPVVTCPGETFASRHSLSHLSNIGLTETIARDLDHYVDIAVSLAHDLPRLAVLRAGLRQRMAASPLCDGRRFAQNLAALLRGVWRQWCQG